MKRLFVIMICGILFPFAGYSQEIDLTKLSPTEREKKAIEIAIDAMKRYAPSYYKDDLKPVLVYEGSITDTKDKNYGRPLYQVDFPFDFTIAKKGENVYGGHVFIYADIGRVFAILPTGWRILFDIPDESDVPSGAYGSPPSVAKPTTVPGKQFQEIKL